MGETINTITNRAISFLALNEKRIFFLFCVIFCAPIILSYRFVTLDGPTHLYNSNLIHQLLFDSNSIANKFFEFNHFPVPNYFYHFAATVLLSFFYDAVVEKTIAVLYVFLFCYGFRQIIHGAKKPIILAYLVLPFVYSYTFFLGFYNFSFAIAFLFWFIAFIFNKNGNSLLKNTPIAIGLYALLYFSHLMVFVIAFIMAFFAEGIKIFAQKKSIKESVLKHLFPSSVFILFSVVFVCTNSSLENNEYLPYLELKNWLIDARPFIVRDYNSEFFYSRMLNVAFVFLFITTLLVNRKVLWSINTTNLVGYFSIILAGVFFCLYFVLPNNLASGGYLSVRLLFFVYLFTVLFLVFVSSKKHLLISFSVCSIIVASFFLLVQHTKKSIDIGNDIKDLFTIENYILKNKILLPIDYSKNPLNSNYLCYLGAIKNIIVLDNYEAGTVHFPLQWKNKMHSPGATIKQYGTVYNPCLPLNEYEKKSGVKIDYIVRWKYDNNTKDSCNLFTDSIINSYYTSIYISPEKKAELFMRKK